MSIDDVVNAMLDSNMSGATWWELQCHQLAAGVKAPKLVVAPSCSGKSHYVKKQAINPDWGIKPVDGDELIRDTIGWPKDVKWYLSPDAPVIHRAHWDVVSTYAREHLDEAVVSNMCVPDCTGMLVIVAAVDEHRFFLNAESRIRGIRNADCKRWWVERSCIMRDGQIARLDPPRAWFNYLENAHALHRSMCASLGKGDVPVAYGSTHSIEDAFCAMFTLEATYDLR